MRLQEDSLNQTLLNEERVIVNQYRMLLKQGEELYKQKSIVNWIKLGDSNTKYFHNSMKVRNARNKIVSLKLHYGETFDQRKIKVAMVEYYKALIRANEFNRQYVCIETIRSGATVSEKEADELCSAITDEEIRAAVWSIGDNKAPGVDGFNSLFFKKVWRIVEADVTGAVKEFFETGWLLKQFNATTSIVIPKIQSCWLDRFQTYCMLYCHLQGNYKNHYKQVKKYSWQNYQLGSVCLCTRKENN